MNEEMIRSAYNNLKIVFQLQAEEVKRLRIINIVLVIFILGLSIILLFK